MVALVLPSAAHTSSRNTSPSAGTAAGSAIAGAARDPRNRRAVTELVRYMMPEELSSFMRRLRLRNTACTELLDLQRLTIVEVATYTA